MYKVSSNYNKVIYSGDAKHRLSLFFNNIEYENANYQVEYVKVKSNILSKGEERFSLDNFVSKEVEIKIHDIELESIVEPVSISIGTLVGNAYEYVPIGIFNLSEAPTKDGNITTIKLRDNSTKFDIPYNAEEVITEHGGEATMLQILQDICTKCEVTLGTTSFINQNTKISVWDNTINARQYVMYIAEKAGSIATIDRTGKLILVPINKSELTTYTLNTNLIESYTQEDSFIISRVVYEDAIRKFEYGSIPTREEIASEITYPSLEIYPSLETYPSDTFENNWYKAKQKTTLYVNTSNPYITDTTEIQNIYNSIKDFSICGMKISKIIGNPALDPYDLITFTYKGNTYTTFAQNTLTYNGVITQSFETGIGTLEKAQENVTLNAQEARWKRVYTEIDQLNGDIKLHTSEISTITVELENQEQTIKKSIKQVQVQYALGDNQTTAPTSGWQNTAPEWQENKYMWQRTITTYNDNTTSTSDPTCIQGAKGDTGQKGNTGIGVKSIQDQYYLSTSSTSQTGGSWKNTQDEWEEGKYIWTRSYITWTNDTTSTTTPVLATGLNNANSLATTANNTATEANNTANTAQETANNASEGVNSINENLKNYYTIEQTNELIQNAQTGLTNTFQTVGGANIFRNTGLWFETGERLNPYEFWSGKAVRTSENKAVNRNAIILQSGTFEQSQQVPNGIYTISFRYQRLLNTSTNNVVINGNSYTLSNNTDTEFEQQVQITAEFIDVQFVSDTNNSCKIYDLMVNVGSSKMTYSQNQNETTTDTVNISKGITITSSDTNTKFKADSDGTRIFNSETNEIKSEFTDKGMKTDELEANSATIAGILIQEVENQTWISKV